MGPTDQKNIVMDNITNESFNKIKNKLKFSQTMKTKFVFADFHFPIQTFIM